MNQKFLDLQTRKIYNIIKINRLIKKENRMERTLENFIVDNSNETAYKAIKKLLKDRKEYLPIYIYGKVGLGKTHLVTGIANKAMEKDRVFLTTCENFINDFMKSNEEKNYLGKYYNCEFLILEDVQYILGKKSIQKEINKIVDDFVSKNKKIVLTSSLPPEISFNIEGGADKFSTFQITLPTVKLKRGIIRMVEEEKDVVFDKENLRKIIDEVDNVNTLLDILKEEYKQIRFDTLI